MSAVRLTLTEGYAKFHRSWNPDLRPASHRRHLYDLLRWKRLMGDTPVGDVRTRDFQEFRQKSASRGDSPSTTETTLGTVRLVLRMCEVHGEIPNTPDRGRARRIPQPSPHVPNNTQVNLLFRATRLCTWPRSSVAPERWWRALLAVGIWTGLRRHDLFWRLSWDHIDAVGKVIVYRSVKDNRERAWPLHPAVEASLDGMVPVGPKRLIFGPSTAIDLIRRELRIMSVEAGINPAVTSQTIRRIGINLWADADEHAGQIIQGTGIKRVWRHYRDQLRRLERAMPEVKLPPEMLAAERSSAERQLTLW